jgi:hypothetical protein
MLVPIWLVQNRPYINALVDRSVILPHILPNMEILKHDHPYDPYHVSLPSFTQNSFQVLVYSPCAAKYVLSSHCLTVAVLVIQPCPAYFLRLETRNTQSGLAVWHSILL